VTVRLVLTAVDNWDTMDGYAAAHGMPYLWDLTLERFCNFTWFMMTRYAEEKDIRDLKAKLWVPPRKDAPIPANSPWSAENESKAFAAVKAMVKPG
jgi:hypothetical protein